MTMQKQPKLEKNIPIQISRWAIPDQNGNLEIESGERPHKMYCSDGTGTPLLLYNRFGADVIRFAGGEGVKNHTHEGSHILFVLKGTGFVEYNGIDHELEPGVCYMIPGNVDHAIKAKSELILIAVGNEHFPVDSKERMTPLFTPEENAA